MQTLERPPLETFPESRVPARPRRWTAVALAAFLALVAFLATWLVVDLLQGPDYDIDVLLDDYATAWSQGDDAALADLVTPGGATLGDGVVATVTGQSVGAVGTFRVALDETPAHVLMRDDPFLIVSRQGVRAVPGGGPEPVLGVFTLVRTESGYRVLRAAWMQMP